MRTLILLLLLASGFGLAALWQSWHVEELRAQQRRSWKISDGELAETESGVLEEGWAAVIVGAPSGAEALLIEVAGSPAQGPNEPNGPNGPGARDGADQQATAFPDPEFEDPNAAPIDAPVLGDFEMEVQPGQTLSGIAHAHYGTASTELVQALADYNGIADPDALRAGAWVLLPERERLLDEE